MKRVKCAYLIIPAIHAFAVTGALRPVQNTFVLSPGVASAFPDANDRNFGGSGSLCVSAAAARAYDPNEGIDHQPKGEFITLLQFAPSLCAGTTLSEMTLKLAITSGNQSAKGIFNFLGSPGDFDLYWISSQWSQGYGTSKIAADSSVGITYTDLVTILEQTEFSYLETLHYDASYAYWEGEQWFEFPLDLEDPNYAGLVDAIEDGEIVTFMLAAAPDSEVCFNIRAYCQASEDGTYTIRETGPYLEIETTLALDAVDFDASGVIDHADANCILDHWQETGDTLIGDIAPLGGDGVIDMLDLTEFMKHWPPYDAMTD